MTETRAERRVHRGRLRSRRVAVVAVIGGLLVAAAVAGDREAPTGGPGPVAAAASASGPVMPAADSMPATWYCAAGTAAIGSRADQLLVMANLDRRPARVVVTVMPGGEARPVSRELSIGGRRQRRLAVADVAAAESPGVVVEAYGGQVVVDHRIAAGADRAAGPCARDAGTRWYTAGGTTAEGAQDWIEVFNPFPDDALVDVQVVTGDGVKERDDLSGLAVPARSKIVVPIHEKVLDAARVGTVVRARIGRVVVEQVLRTAAPYPRPGLALSLAVPRPAARWYFPAGPGAATDTQSLAVLNPSEAAVPVTITTTLDSDQFLKPDVVTVDGRSVGLVDLKARLPAGVGYWVRVDAPRPVVAEVLLGRTGVEGGDGLAAGPGATAAATRWAVAGARTRDGSADRIVVVNPGRRTVRVALRAVGNGRDVRLGRRAGLALAPGRRAVVDLVAAGTPLDAAVVVEATGPVIVGHESGTAPGVMLRSAVPFAS